MGLGDPEMIEEGSDIVGVGVTLPKNRASGLTIASHIVTNDAVMFGEGLELVVPRARSVLEIYNRTVNEYVNIMDDVWGTEEDLYYVDPDDEISSQIAVLYGISPETINEDELILIPGKLFLKKINSEVINDRLHFQKNRIPWKEIIVLDLNEISGREMFSQFNPLNLGLLSLRLLKPCTVYFGPIITHSEDKSTISMTNFDRIPTPFSFFNLMYLDDDEKQELVTIINGIQNLDPDNTPFLRIAFNRFSSYSSNRHLEDKLIDLCIAFEALFLKGEYKRNKPPMGVLIGKLCSDLIGKSKEDKKIVSSLIRTCYDLRNTVVHGGAIKEDEIRNVLPQLENTFRRSIKVHLE